METIIGPRFVVVIPCYNEEKYVTGLLEDLCQQTVQPDMVVVADCDSEDNTVEAVAQFADRLPLQIVRSRGRSPAAARNTAVESTNCRPEDYLIFIDADMRVQPDFVQKLQAETRKYPVDSVTPEFKCDGHYKLYRLFMLHSNLYHRYVITMRNRAAGMVGVMVVRKGMHDYVGGFPEDMGIVADDLWYVARLNKAGATARYAATIQVVNSSRRLSEDGVLGWFIAMRPDESLLARAHQRLTGAPSRRVYGHYGRKAKA